MLSKNNIIPHLQKRQLFHSITFMQDEAPPHIATPVTIILHKDYIWRDPCPESFFSVRMTSKVTRSHTSWLLVMGLLEVTCVLYREWPTSMVHLKALYAFMVQGYPLSTFGETHVLSSSFLHEWPPRSPDLALRDFLLWGYLKEHVYCTEIGLHYCSMSKMLHATMFQE